MSKLTPTLREPVTFISPAAPPTVNLVPLQTKLEEAPKEPPLLYCIWVFAPAGVPPPPPPEVNSTPFTQNDDAEIARELETCVESITVVKFPAWIVDPVTPYEAEIPYVPVALT